MNTLSFSFDNYIYRVKSSENDRKTLIPTYTSCPAYSLITGYCKTLTVLGILVKVYVCFYGKVESSIYMPSLGFYFVLVYFGSVFC